MLDYEKVLKYNRSSLIKYNWTPSWFGGEALDSDLVDLVCKFQEENGLSPDGLVGPSTYRRVLAEALSKQSGFKGEKTRKRKKEMFLIYNGEEYKIFWPKVRIYTEKSGLSIEGKNYYSFQDKPKRDPIQFVNHWDAALTSKSCVNIINKRNLSMHFCIDNDGTIYQLMDMQDAAWQAGNKLSNIIGLGVEISNAFYPKYQNWYVKNGFGKRPIEPRSTLHTNKIVQEHLGFYKVQLDALAALWECVSYACNIPLEVCETKGVDEDCVAGKFNGFINHFNLTNNKIDCASLNMKEVLEVALEVRAERELTFSC
jgi:RNAse (barnase) inhibitor barstar